MAGDRGLAFVFIGLMGISLSWIVEARVPGNHGNVRVVPLADAPPAVAAQTSEPSMVRTRFLNSQLKRIPGTTRLHPRLSERSLRRDDFNTVSADFGEDNAEASRLVVFSGQ